MRRIVKSNNNINSIHLICIGAFIILLFTFLIKLYLQSALLKSKTDGLTKTVFLKMENNSDLDTLASLTVKLNGHSIFSNIVVKECFELVDVNLFEGKNKIELFANGQLNLQDSIAVSWPQMYYLNIKYYDSVGQQNFNYIIEEYFFQ